MNDYLDTGILLKLYTAELESAAVQAFVQRRRQAIPVTDLHQAECMSALRLKQFRGECTGEEASQAWKTWQHDLRVGVLRLIAVDWNRVWLECRNLTDTYTGLTGCRTIDTLHVASAKILGFRRVVTSDGRQTALAKRTGLSAINPVSQQH